MCRQVEWQVGLTSRTEQVFEVKLKYADNQPIRDVVMRQVFAIGSHWKTGTPQLFVLAAAALARPLLSRACCADLDFCTFSRSVDFWGPKGEACLRLAAIDDASRHILVDNHLELSLVMQQTILVRVVGQRLTA